MYCLVSDSPPAWTAIDNGIHSLYYYYLAIINKKASTSNHWKSNHSFRAYTDPLSKTHYEIWVSVLETHSADWGLKLLCCKNIYCYFDPPFAEGINHMSMLTMLRKL